MPALTTVQSPTPLASIGKTEVLTTAFAANRALHRTYVIEITGTINLDIEGSYDGENPLPVDIASGITASTVISQAEVCHYHRVVLNSGDGSYTVTVMS